MYHFSHDITSTVAQSQKSRTDFERAGALVIHKAVHFGVDTTIEAEESRVISNDQYTINPVPDSQAPKPGGNLGQRAGRIEKGTDNLMTKEREHHSREWAGTVLAY